MALVLTSWNLQGSHGVDVDAVAARVTALGADVLLLQEVQRRQAQALARALGARSITWTFKHWPGRTSSEGMAVVGVTTPAKARRGVAITYRWRWWSYRRRVAQVAQVMMDGRDSETDLRLVNVHLTPHGSEGERRQREMTWLLRRFPPSRMRAGSADAVTGARSLVIAGDFNGRPDADMFGRLRDAGLRDAWVEAHGDDAGAGMTNWRGGPADIPPQQRIDYIWASTDLVVKDAVVPVHGEPGFSELPTLSDHLPLTVTLDT